MFEIMNTLGDFIGAMCWLPVVFLVGWVVLGIAGAIADRKKVE